jgi:hypothetical protein
MSTHTIKRGPGRPAGSKNKSKTDVTVVKRGRGRPPGSMNKVNTKVSTTTKQGRGRPKGSKNKTLIVEVPNDITMPFPDPIHESQRLENIRHMVSFYQNSDGTKKFGASAPKKRGRKSALENFDPEKLLKEDLDSDKLTYNDNDVKDELGRMDGFIDMSKNRNRYRDEF